MSILSMETPDSEAKPGKVGLNYPLHSFLFVYYSFECPLQFTSLAPPFAGGGQCPTFHPRFLISLIDGIQEMNLLVWNSNTLTAHQLIGSGKQ